MTLPTVAVADQSWLATAAEHGGQHWISNAPCAVSAVAIAGEDVPLTRLLTRQADNSYVASPQSAWVRYPAAEAARHLPNPLRPLVPVAAATLAALVRLAGVDRAAILGNHLLSTNLLPAWSADALRPAMLNLTQRHPEIPLAMRSLCPDLQPTLATALRSLGWKLLVARQIYIANPADPALWKHNHLRKDQRLLDDTAVDVVFPDEITASELPRLRELFRQLFIDKHSPLNPDFTPAFFAFCLRSGFLELYALRYQGQLVGVLGLYARQGWLTTPLIGYDTALPQSLGLYRRLMALLYRQARERGLRLHLSSGADAFKRARGGVAHLEYTGIYAGHLPARQRLAVAALARTLNSLAPRALARL